MAVKTSGYAVVVADLVDITHLLPAGILDPESVQVIGMLNPTEAPGMVCPTARLERTRTLGRLNVIGKGAVQALYLWASDGCAMLNSANDRSDVTMLRCDFIGATIDPFPGRVAVAMRAVTIIGISHPPSCNPS